MGQILTQDEIDMLLMEASMGSLNPYSCRAECYDILILFGIKYSILAKFEDIDESKINSFEWDGSRWLYGPPEKLMENTYFLKNRELLVHLNKFKSMEPEYDKTYNEIIERSGLKKIDLKD